MEHFPKKNFLSFPFLKYLTFSCYANIRPDIVLHGKVIPTVAMWRHSCVMFIYHGNSLCQQSGKLGKLFLIFVILLQKLWSRICDAFSLSYANPLWITIYGKYFFLLLVPVKLVKQAIHTEQFTILNQILDGEILFPCSFIKYTNSLRNYVQQIAR